MHFNNEGLTVGELSITIAALIIVGFIWTTLSTEKSNQEVSMFINNSSEINCPKQLQKQNHLLIII